MVHTVVSTTIQVAIAALVFLSGALAAIARMSVQASVDDGILSQILGPLGALAFAVVTVWFLVRYLQRKERRLEKLQDDQLRIAQEDARYWRDKALGKRRNETNP